MNVQEIYDVINGFAPFETAESYDNSGILCGSLKNEVNGILVCLDVTSRSIEEAIRSGCNLIVSHHPILFHGRKNLTEDDPEGRLLVKLVRNNINLIAAHTNFDFAPEGVSFRLAEALGLNGIEQLECGIVAGSLPETVSFEEFCGSLSAELDTVVRGYDSGKPIRKVAVCGGAGGEFYKDAINCGADAYVTGEIRYHDSLDAMDYGLSTFSVGHDSSERIAVKPLADMIAEALRAKNEKVDISIFD